jgi:hypothetical protein
MDWIERLFHVSPDRGSGSLEIGMVAGAAIALVMVIARGVKMRPAVERWLAVLTSHTRGVEPRL